MLRISIPRFLQKMQVAAAPSAAVATCCRFYSSKAHPVQPVEEDENYFSDKDFMWLDEFFGEGAADMIDFIPEDEAKFLESEAPKKK